MVARLSSEPPSSNSGVVQAQSCRSRRQVTPAVPGCGGRSDGGGWKQPRKLQKSASGGGCASERRFPAVLRLAVGTPTAGCSQSSRDASAQALTSCVHAHMHAHPCSRRHSTSSDVGRVTCGRYNRGRFAPDSSRELYSSRSCLRTLTSKTTSPVSSLHELLFPGKKRGDASQGHRTSLPLWTAAWHAA